MDRVTPSDLLDEANRLLYGDLTDVSRFATMWVGQYNPATRCLDYANAGHSPVIYCSVNGQAQMLEADGVPLGVLDDCLVEPRGLRFGVGDVLIIATDGFPEAENKEGDMLGYDSLMELATWAASDEQISAEKVRQLLFDSVFSFSGRRAQTDDMTAIVLKGVAA